MSEEGSRKGSIDAAIAAAKDFGGACMD